MCRGTWLSASVRWQVQRMTSTLASDSKHNSINIDSLLYAVRLTCRAVIYNECNSTECNKHVAIYYRVSYFLFYLYFCAKKNILKSWTIELNQLEVTWLAGAYIRCTVLYHDHLTRSRDSLGINENVKILDSFWKYHVDVMEDSNSNYWKHAIIIPRKCDHNTVPILFICRLHLQSFLPVHHSLYISAVER